jgi:hypothetical protein
LKGRAFVAIGVGVVLAVFAGVIFVKVRAQAGTPVMCLVPPCEEIGRNIPWLAAATLLAVLGVVTIAVGVIRLRRAD